MQPMFIKISNTFPFKGKEYPDYSVILNPPGYRAAPFLCKMFCVPIKSHLQYLPIYLRSCINK